MKNEYSDKELSQLHEALLSILEEIVRVCKLLDIKFFVIGGTAIGVYYFKGFVKWDDDIDLGMRREDYSRFIKEAPKLISSDYFIQCFETEPNTPHFFIKVRKNNTLFVESTFKELPIHQGIFVDIFPFDIVPDNRFIAKCHQRLVQYFEGLFKKSLMKQSILESQQKLPHFISKPLADIRYFFLRLLPRGLYYWCLNKVSSLFNKKRCSYVDMIKTSIDHIPSSSLSNLVKTSFEGIEVYAPKDLTSYLHYHYPDLKSADMLEALWINHAPETLIFDSSLTPPAETT